MLADRDRRVLEFEAAWWTYPGPKDVAIRDYLGMSATRYYQVLRRLLDDPAALEHDPMTIKRLQLVRHQATQRLLARLDGSGS